MSNNSLAAVLYGCTAAIICLVIVSVTMARRDEANLERIRAEEDAEYSRRQTQMELRSLEARSRDAGLDVHFDYSAAKPHADD